MTPAQLIEAADRMKALGERLARYESLLAKIKQSNYGMLSGIPLTNYQAELFVESAGEGLSARISRTESEMQALAKEMGADHGSKSASSVAPDPIGVAVCSHCPCGAPWIRRPGEANCEPLANRRKASLGTASEHPHWGDET
jgi:hypothetical protein